MLIFWHCKSLEEFQCDHDVKFICCLFLSTAEFDDYISGDSHLISRDLTLCRNGKETQAKKEKATEMDLGFDFCCIHPWIGRVSVLLLAEWKRIIFPKPITSFGSQPWLKVANIVQLRPHCRNNTSNNSKTRGSKTILLIRTRPPSCLFRNFCYCRLYKFNKTIATHSYTESYLKMPIYMFFVHAFELRMIMPFSFKMAVDTLIFHVFEYCMYQNLAPTLQFSFLHSCTYWTLAPCITLTILELANLEIIFKG